MVLEPGANAPEIRASNQWDEGIEPAFDAAVVYFYPRDGTPGCTTQANQFDVLFDQFAEHGVSIYGVSTDDVEDHCDFAEDHDLDIDLLADPAGEITDAFDVPVEDDRAQRTTFVIARQRIIGVYEGVRPDGHARELLRDLKEAGLLPMSNSTGT